jgi:hypothetical protein
VEQALQDLKVMCHTKEGYIGTARSGCYALQMWARDLLLGLLSGYISLPEAKAAIMKFLDAQLDTGELPYRFELNHHLRSIVAQKIVMRDELTPIYEGDMGALPARDTIPCIVIAFYLVHTRLKKESQNPREAQVFLNAYREKLNRAMQWLLATRRKTGFLATPPLSDWIDNIKRGQGLCFLNMLGWHACLCMTTLCKGHSSSQTEYYRAQALALYGAIDTLWHRQGQYFCAGIRDDRIDAAANVYACLVFGDVDTNICIQGTLSAKLLQADGMIKPFDRPYPRHRARLLFQLTQFHGYGDEYYYPWIANLNVVAMLRLAKQYLRIEDREGGYNQWIEACEQFYKLSQLYANLGGHLEVLDTTLKPASHEIHWWGQKKPITYFEANKGFLASVGTYLAAYRALSGRSIYH